MNLFSPPSDLNIIDHHFHHTVCFGGVSSYAVSFIQQTTTLNQAFVGLGALFLLLEVFKKQ